VAAACGDIILFLDDDCICDPELLGVHHEAHTHADKLVVIGVVTLHPDSPRGTLYDLKRGDDPEGLRLRPGEDPRAGLMLCANSSIARQGALDCPFDVTYKRIHDVEVGGRLRAKGYRPRFAPNAIVYEHFTKTVSGVLRDSNLQGKYEVILTTSQPGFKPFAGLAVMNEGNPAKRALRKRLAFYPRASEFVLRFGGSLLESVRVVPAFSRLAKRVLGARAMIAMLSGGIQEAGSWAKLEELFGGRIPVIMYHNVGSPRPDEFPGLTTPRSEFEAQISFLSRMGYKGIRPSEWLQWRDAAGTLPERPVMLVFDDAYAEACHNAFPVLERYGFGAACMVVTRYIGSTNRWDEEVGRPSLQLMSKSEILEWSEKGIEFGGHTSHHLELPTAPSDRIRQEIEECRDDLTELLGRAPTCFAYPFGQVSPEVQAAVRDHFELAFTVGQGVLHLNTDPHLVPRIFFLPGETRFGIWCRLRLGRNLIDVCQRRWAMLRQKVRDLGATHSALPG
jgi:peptidoglycan/xylan/chitin deacetylase (PgdA/CDA1 family)